MDFGLSLVVVSLEAIEVGMSTLLGLLFSKSLVNGLSFCVAFGSGHCCHTFIYKLHNLKKNEVPFFSDFSSMFFLSLKSSLNWSAYLQAYQWEILVWKEMEPLCSFLMWVLKVLLLVYF